MRSRNRSGVTDDSDASGDHMVRSQVTDRLGEGPCGRLHHLAKRNGKQVLCFATEMLNPPVCQQTFRDRIAARTTVAIDHDLLEQAFIRHTVPNPVVEPMARMDVVMLARDEITEDVRVLVVGESEVLVKHLSGRRGHRVFGKQSSPSEITRIGWPHGWPELATHDRISSVGAD